MLEKTHSILPTVWKFLPKKLTCLDTNHCLSESHITHKSDHTWGCFPPLKECMASERAQLFFSQQLIQKLPPSTPAGYPVASEGPVLPSQLLWVLPLGCLCPSLVNLFTPFCFKHFSPFFLQYFITLLYDSRNIFSISKCLCLPICHCAFFFPFSDVCIFKDFLT